MNDPVRQQIKPDAEIEEFWIGFKKSMNNFYTSTSNNHTQIQRDITKWSNKLNTFQELEMYEEIEKCIRDYISLYAIDVIRSPDINQQYFKLLVTNIKRWDKLSKKYNFNPNTNKQTSQHQTEYYSIMYLIIDLYKSVLTDEKGRELFKDVELLLLNKDFTDIIKYAVTNNKPGILTKIGRYYNLPSLITNIYGIEFPSNRISAAKIINMVLN